MGRRGSIDVAFGFDASTNPLRAATRQTKDLLLDSSIERYERLQELACTSEDRAARVLVAGKRVHLLSYHLDEGSGDRIRDLCRDVDHRVTRYELFVERRRQDDLLHAVLRIEPVDALRGFLSVLPLQLDHPGAAVEQGVTHDGRGDLQLDHPILGHVAPPLSATTRLLLRASRSADRSQMAASV